MAADSAQSRVIERCQICQSSALKSILFLGYVPPVNTMPPVGRRAEQEPSFPLELLRCESCGLAQIGLEVSPEVLFPYSYPYLSGTTQILKENFADLYREASTLIALAPDDLVADVGSNDGTLLVNFKDRGHRVLGIEPSQAAKVAQARGVDTIIEYFRRDVAQRVRLELGAAKIVTAANVFAHIAEPTEVVAAIIDLLAEDGVFISESHYLLDLIETLQYDTIYHEHLRYYSLGSLARLLGQQGLEIFHIKRIPTHGGSIRVYAARKGQYPIAGSVAERHEHEQRFGLADGSAFNSFRERVIRSRFELMTLLARLTTPQTKIYGIGAPSRASTLIAYAGIDDGMLQAVMEVPGSHKLDKYIPGTRIPVMDETSLYKDQPDYALMLSWHIADELAGKLRQRGYRGKFIVPLPTPRVIE